MNYLVTLTILNGKLKGQQFSFANPTVCSVGRAKNCTISFTNCTEHSDIYDYHCNINIDPPKVKVKNHDLKSGDVINLGSVEIEVQISNPNNIPDNNNNIHEAVTLSINSDSDIEVTPRSNNLLNLIKNLLKRALSKKEANLIAIEGYNIEKVLGKGGFGEVYLAKHRQLQEYVALKVMLPQVAASKRQRDKFFRELDNMKALNHPNIVRLKDYGFSDNIFFFTLEYCDGGTLRDLLKYRKKPLEPKEAVDLINPILDALEYAHQVVVPHVKLSDGRIGQGSGLVHRDINPSNILIRNEGGIMISKLADFGLSKAFDQAGLSGVSQTGKDLEGTFEYMCRQQVIQFKFAKPEIDIWAAVACLYYLLTGYSPRKFDGKMDPLMVVLQTNPIPIKSYNSNLPQPLANLIDLALIDHPQLHFKNAAAFKRALATVI
jgi:eukaryotic-like serine/threonine-protein kinase